MLREQLQRTKWVESALAAAPRIADCYRADARFSHFDESASTRVVAIAGTDSLNDIINDLRMELTPASVTPDLLLAGARVHAGVLATYHKCADDLLSACLPTRKLILVGHSLGAGLACLTAYALVALHRFSADDITVVCLGSPRLGDAAWAKAYDALIPATLRVETSIDPVTKLPPPWGWRHVGQTLRLNADGEEKGTGFGALLHLLYACRCAKIRAIGHSLFDYTAAMRLYLERVG